MARGTTYTGAMAVIGVFVERHALADYLWNQTDGPFGRHGGLRFMPNERDADVVLMIGSPIGLGTVEPTRRRGFGRLIRGRESERERLERAWASFGVARERTWVLFYEPPTYVSDAAFDAARRHAARVYGPDERATYPIRLPTLWSDQMPLAVLRGERAPSRDDGTREADVVCVSSGKRVVPGHDARLEFLKRLRRAGVGLELFGRGLDRELGGRGEVQGKGIVVRGSRLTLVIENDATGERYVSEKLWDAIVGWSLPLYHGSSAAEGMIPVEAMIRLPDLGEAGVEVVRRAVEDPDLPWSRMGAIAEARERVLGEHRIVEWVRGELERR